MNQKIFITSVEVYNNDRDPFPMSLDVEGAFLVDFSPAPLGTTGNIYLRVTSTVVPADQGQVLFKLQLINGADFKFSMGNGYEIKYYREVKTGEETLLPLEIQNVTPLENALVAQISLVARDADPNPPNSSTFPASIIGKN